MFFFFFFSAARLLIRWILYCTASDTIRSTLTCYWRDLLPPICTPLFWASTISLASSQIKLWWIMFKYHRDRFPVTKTDIRHSFGHLNPGQKERCISVSRYSHCEESPSTSSSTSHFSLFPQLVVFKADHQSRGGTLLFRHVNKMPRLGILMSQWLLYLRPEELQLFVLIVWKALVTRYSKKVRPRWWWMCTSTLVHKLWYEDEEY